MKSISCALLALFSSSLLANSFPPWFSCEVDLASISPARKSEIARLFQGDDAEAAAFVGLSRRELIELIQVGRVCDRKVRVELRIGGDADDPLAVAEQRASLKVMMDMLHERLSHGQYFISDALLERLLLALRPHDRSKTTFSPDLADLYHALEDLPMPVTEPHITEVDLDEELQESFKIGMDYPRLIRAQKLERIVTAFGLPWQITTARAETYARLLRLFAHLPYAGGAIAGVRADVVPAHTSEGVAYLPGLRLRDLCLLEPNGIEELRIFLKLVDSL